MTKVKIKYKDGDVQEFDNISSFNPKENFVRIETHNSKEPTRLINKDLIASMEVED